jgi:lactate dehydrogenase-like 2-hydroxyacid dehydrogenase
MSIMTKPKVILTRRWPAEIEQAIGEHFDAVPNADDRPFSRDDLMQALRSADALFPTVTDRLDSEVLGVRPMRARFLGNYGVGFNHIDLGAAKAAGLVVTNTPDVLTDATADLAMALILAVARRLGEGEREVRAGAWRGWRPTHPVGTQVTGKVLGLIGLGRIGQAVAKRAHRGFAMPIIAYDPYPPEKERLAALGATLRGSIEAVLEEADFVSIHCPATPQNRHLMNAARLQRMKPGAYLINTARGDIVDEAALVEALRSGRLAGAGLDVYEREPEVGAGLLALDNVTLLPHLGSATQEARIAMGRRTLDNALAFFDGREPPDRIA